MNISTVTQKHQLSDIKLQKSRLFNPVSTMQRLNRDLAEILNFDGEDQGLCDYLVDRYLQTLDIYHKNGRSGSLLPQAKAVQQ